MALKDESLGVLTVAQWVKDLTTAAWVDVEALVPSSAQQSRLRTQYCHSCSIGHSCSSDLIPGPRTPICYRCSQKKKGKKKDGNLAFPDGLVVKNLALSLLWVELIPGPGILHAIDTAQNKTKTSLF